MRAIKRMAEKEMLCCVGDSEEQLDVCLDRIDKLESRWAALRDIFQITIDNYEDDPRYYYDVMTAKSVIEEMDKLEGEG